MQRFRFLALFMFFVTLTFSQNNPSIDFTIRNLGINVKGHFDKFSITTKLSSQKEFIGLSGNIKVNSIDTGIDSRDEHLLKGDYFNAEKHTLITLQSIKITKKTASEYLAKARLTIKGKTKNISIPVKVEKIIDAYKITSSFEINRRDFDVGGGSFVMSKMVKINVVHYQEL
jgi:polyisoprenoid-binding protein YceI